MRKKYFFFILLVSCFYHASIGIAQSQDTKITVTAFPGRVVQDWDGNPVLFQDAPAPIRFFLAVNATEDLPPVNWEKLFSFYHVSGWVDEKPIGPDDLKIERKMVKQKTQLWEVIKVSPKEGAWPAGYLTIGGSFDLNELKENHLPAVELLDGNRQIRAACRPLNGEADKLVMLRNDVFRYAELEQVMAPDMARAWEAVQALLAQFPDDVYGHAYAGWILEQENRLPEEALFHYQKAKTAIVSSFPKSPPFWLVLQQPGTVAYTEKYRKLRFDRWRGITGPVKLEAELTKRIEKLKSQIASPQP